ncbi:MAG TPA: prepilin-type N-terminal cleavage/methylation domain-containing protein [Candidatus Pacearchaeota archaeon]|nr:prepilin-type N-terminal cleavage/methylation domain-containing protein [Candidatus Pacearchaeota archaeon]
MSKNKSFTLIELLVVIVIIGILAGVIMISTSSSIDKANFAKAQTFSNTVQEELLLNLVSEWTFDNPSNIGEDTWGNNNGTLVGTPQSIDESSCIFGGCVYFSGAVGNYIQISSSQSLKNIDEITLSFWFKNYTTGTSQGPVSKMYGTKPYWSIWFSNGRYHVWEIADVTSAYYRPDSSHKFDHEKWYYVVVTQKGANYTTYSNSIIGLQNNDIANFSESKSDSNLLIGSLTTTSCPFKGYIDDVRIYNAALSTSQIKQNYIAGLNSMLSNGNISNEEYNERINELAYQ